MAYISSMLQKLMLRRFCHRLWVKNKKTPSQKMKYFWSGRPEVLNKPWQAFDYIVIDFEFSSLDSKSGEIISLGWVKIFDGSIEVNSSKYVIVQSETDLNESAAIHHLRHCDLKKGELLNAAIDELLDDMYGSILVFHHSPLDLKYLNQSLLKFHNGHLYSHVVDTLFLEKRKWLRHHDHIPADTLSLENCRLRYGLPSFPMHHAFEDAMATAELFLAHIHHKGNNVLAKNLVLSSF